VLNRDIHTHIVLPQQHVVMMISTLVYTSTVGPSRCPSLVESNRTIIVVDSTNSPINIIITTS
jgi:hypothetical protein